jgi:predicted dehydrogenase
LRRSAEDNAIFGMRAEEQNFTPIPVPDLYAFLPVGHLDASARDVAYLYDAYAKDKETGSSEATTFMDAIHQHRLIDAIACRNDIRPLAGMRQLSNLGRQCSREKG